MASSPSKHLNPTAKEWNPTTDSSPVELRCLFMTFSNGYSVSHRKLRSFFKRICYPYLESVYVHDPNWPNGSPQFGRIKFKARAVVERILGSGKERMFVVNGRPVLCKKYDITKKKIWVPKGKKVGSSSAPGGA